MHLSTNKPITLKLLGHQRSKNQLKFSFSIDDLEFSTSLWYDAVDFYQLETRYGTDFMEKIYFHIAAIDATKFVSLRPDFLDFGPYQRFVTSTFKSLWDKIIAGVWGQWRYENNAPDYLGPQFPVSGDLASPVALLQGNTPVLNLCGGGKDSLLGMRLLQQAGLEFDSLGYSHSIYGQADEQHNLIDRLLSLGKPHQKRKIWIYDDFLDSPILRLRDDFSTCSLTAAETPTSIFATMPLVLSHNYNYLCFAHEQSADFGNCVWELTGESINHQWGKSTQAEVLINEYLSSNLVENLNLFSILKPLYDIGIFSLLQHETDGLKAAHSCNIEKPWCMKCAKCAYVWLNYKAWFSDKTVDPIFEGRNLLDIPENQPWFRQLIGLDGHTPFECVGTAEESRLAFELCRLKGIEGLAMKTYNDSNLRINDPISVARKYLTLANYSHMPSAVGPSLSAILKNAEPNGISYISSLLSKSA
jgi:UDP-N-acetyl-alpha-D-muramoyl-L-alanyl-L-glutamate epimerase